MAIPEEFPELLAAITDVLLSAQIAEARKPGERSGGRRICLRRPFLDGAHKYGIRGAHIALADGSAGRRQQLGAR